MGRVEHRRWVRVLRLVGIVLCVVLVIGAAWFLYLLDAGGQFRSIEERAVGECRKVPGTIGAEDIVVDRGARVALLSADDRRGDAGGGIYSYDLAAGDRVSSLTEDLDIELRPHGISLVETREGRLLYVVNHAGGNHSIEVFEWNRDDQRQLEYLRTVTDPLLISPNDVAAVDEVRFYATNDHGTDGGGAVLEDLLRQRRGSVVYWDGSTMRTVADTLGYPNGIALSLTGEELYIASTTTGELLVYDRDLDTGALSYYKTIETGTGIDNITVDLYGKLWIAAHPHLFDFMRHASNPERRSPSEVIWIDPDEMAEPSVRSVWVSEGEDLSGSSVVVPHGADLIIGSVFEPHVLVCARG